MITKSFNIYLGNTGDEEMLVKEGELFGFGTGSFEVKLIQGSLKLHDCKICCDFGQRS